LKEEEDIFSLSSLLKREVRDAEDRDIGHVQDLSVDLGSQPPVVSELAVHLQWTDRIGDLILPRPVEDIILLLPWSEVESLEPEVLLLRNPHPFFEVVSSEGKILARRDILNKQITDEEGNRLHRVDDVLMRQEGVLLFLEGLQVGTEWLPAGSRMGRLVSKLRSRYNRPGETNIIPYEAILRVDEEALVIRT
jgi:sporulation protein YlmC with PRC-barrel domain